MKIINALNVDMGPECACNVYQIHIKIVDIAERAKVITDSISDKSWISKLDAVDRKSYEARAAGTIKKLVDNILAKVTDQVTEDFGEYLVSDSASAALADVHKHSRIALAELWKEQVSGNPGFDFHTECPASLICYGEAKYKSTGSPYTVAINQIRDFISDKKDQMELVDLKCLVSSAAIQNALDDKKAFIAAFSLNAVDKDEIFRKAIQKVVGASLLTHNELYLIGVEI